MGHGSVAMAAAVIVEAAAATLLESGCTFSHSLAVPPSRTGAVGAPGSPARRPSSPGTTPGDARAVGLPLDLVTVPLAEGIGHQRHQALRVQGLAALDEPVHLQLKPG